MTTPAQNFGFMDYLLDYADRARENRAKANSAPRVAPGPEMLFRGDFIDPRVPTDQIGPPIIDALKGYSVGAFTAAPDILGMTRNLSTNPMSMLPGDQTGSIVPEGYSGQPIRDLAGLEEDSIPGLLGEMASPMTGGLKTGIGVTKALTGMLSRHGPEILTALAAAGPKGLLAIPTFHGTPHKFDFPSNEFMSTGEGGQAYGFGHYVAEDKEVGRFYRDELSQEVNTLPEGFSNEAKNFVAEYAGPDDRVDDFWMQNMRENASRNSVENKTIVASKEITGQDTPAWVSGTVEEAYPGKFWIVDKDDFGYVTGPYNSKAQATQRLPEQYLTSEQLAEINGLTQDDIVTSSGHLYEYDIPDEQIDQMLEWDKRLSEQPEGVQNALARMGVTKASIDDVADIRQNVHGDGKWYPVNKDGEWGTTGFGTRQDAVDAIVKDSTALDQNLLAVDNDGGHLYRQISNRLGGDEAASRALAEAGVPGIRYLDGNSRGAALAGGNTLGPQEIRLLEDITDAEKAGDKETVARLSKELDELTADPEGTSNMVLFDPESSIKSVKRDGELVFGAEDKSGGLLGDVSPRAATAKIPEKLYHGSYSPEDTLAKGFQGGRVGKVFLSDNPEYSAGYGDNVFEVELNNVKNPADLVNDEPLRQGVIDRFN